MVQIGWQTDCNVDVVKLIVNHFSNEVLFLFLAKYGWHTDSFEKKYYKIHFYN